MKLTGNPTPGTEIGGNQFSIFLPMTKIDEARREVWGVLAEEAPDKKDQIFDYGSSKPFVKGWSDWAKTASGGKSAGNLRAMHQDIAAGKFIHIEFDDENKRILCGAKVVDDNEWAKCLEGVYTGFSLGGDKMRVWRDSATGMQRYTGKPVEGSLADNPAMYGATFTVVKLDGSTDMRNFVGGSGVKDPNLTQEIGTMAKMAKKKVMAEGSTEAGKLMQDLKAFVAEHNLLEGDPATWDFAQMGAAITGAITSGDGAGSAPAAPAPDAAAGTVEETAGAPAEDPAAVPAEKKDETEMTKTAVVDEATGLKAIVTDVVKALGSIGTAMQGMSEGLKGLTPEALAKTVKPTVDGAVGAAVADLQTTIGGLTQRLQAVEATPGQVGTPIGTLKKTLGPAGADGAGEGEGITPADLERAVEKLEAAGMDPNTRVEMRKSLAAATMMLGGTTPRK